MVSSTCSFSEVSWVAKTYKDILDVATMSGSVLVVPVGSIEQHGHHMPVGTDTILATAIATHGAEQVHDELPVLVAPPVYPGYSPHHLPFGGTLSLSFEHLLSVVVDVVETGLQNGFDAVLLINGHGGNIPLIGAATAIIGDEHPEALVHGLTYFDLAAPFIDGIRDSPEGGMGHAGEFETSLMLHLRPELVDEDNMAGTSFADPNEYVPTDMFGSGPLGIHRPFEAYTDSGTIGDPEYASAEKGERIHEGLTAELAAILLEIHGEVA